MTGATLSPSPHRGLLRPLSAAPMMDRSDRHFRVLLRQITRRTLLYTEMLTASALLHGDREHLLGFDPVERPLALQVGGDDPADLAACARIAEDFGYDEINLNVGCPSPRVQRGCFGVVLMGEPERVARAVAAMREAASIPVTVKHRVGFDDRDRYEDMLDFVQTVAAAGCDRFTVHARKAWLSGLSPRENRRVPPLRYDHVYRLKRERPDLAIELNGGVLSLDEAEEHLRAVDAVMIGRAAYEDPLRLAGADDRFFGDGPLPPSGGERCARDAHAVVEAMLPYVARWVAAGGRMHPVTRHMLGLFSGRRGARAWRRHLSEQGVRRGADAEVLRAALARVPRDA